MKIKRIAICPCLIPEFFKDLGLIRVTKALPKDAKFLRANYDNVRDLFYLIFESEEWPEVLDGCAIEEFMPEFERITKGDIKNDN